MVFTELSPFVAFRDEHWNDDEFRRFQATLMQSPKAGDVIRGGRGLRKLRWLAQGAASAVAQESFTIFRMQRLRST